ncbi:hypothetical protein CC80DRAFT_476030 [Byssothecium circinans]|uniref:Uncharacterized protein n=1 Tax=Byssothecium circinans TaxID=147558 RepID=A0A6A5TQQ6_9PLEO|nr:hypothetical protein CC80DRAFT_476030 [Byssothecium circinans]
MLLTAPKDRDSLFAAVKMQSRSLGGLPTLQQIRLTPSASFMTAYQKAKQLALGEVKCTTVIAVNLTDVHIFELAQQGRSEEYFSFAHVFVAAVGPEGVIIWQSWGKYGYRLDEYLRRGDGRLRDWPEADQFVDDFMTLASQNGAWTGKRNRLYKRLFHIDLQKLCGSKGAERPLTPRYEPWVRLHTFEDVKYDDVTKFRWTLS